MSLFRLSNLQLRSNLLTFQEYQRDLRRVTVFEFKNIRERNPILIAPHERTDKHQQQWKDALFWGDSSVSLDDGDRRRAWLERLAEGVEDALASLEDRPDAEGGFEVLCVTESLSAPSLDSHYAAMVEEWGRRARALLGRAGFRLTPAMIDGMLSEILGTPVQDRTQSPPPGPQVPATQPSAELS